MNSSTVGNRAAETEVSRRLTSCRLDPDEVRRLVEVALAEDLPTGTDVTTLATVPAGLTGQARFVPRAAGILAGLPAAVAVVLEVARRHDAAVEVSWAAGDGDRATPGTAVLTISGPVRVLLTAERTALNLLTHASGVATLTRRYVDAVAGTSVTVLDTRKTLPGLRALEKHAVRCGGGANKRLSLSEAALVKDNHVLAAGGVAAAFHAVRREFPGVDVQVECDTVEQVGEALAAGATFLLCDNMELVDLRAAVDLARGRAEVEATGGITLERIAAVAATGVDYVSVGAITAAAPSLDIGVDLDVAGAPVTTGQVTAGEPGC